MKVVLVGPPATRERLRAQLNGAAIIVGECASLGLAQAARFDADAFVIAAGSTSVAQDFSTAGALAQAVSPAIEPLTPREIQVLELLAEGRSNKAIGRQLGISDQTVKFYVAAIAGKLGAVNRTDAVRLAIRRGIVSV